MKSQNDGPKQSMYLYRAVVTEDEDGYYLDFPDFDSCFADGDTLNEAVENGVMALRLVIAEYLDSGRNLPTSAFEIHDGNEMNIVVAVSVTEDFIKRTKCLTISEAARELNVTPSRICHLIDSQKLTAIPYGSNRLVTIASVSEYRATSRKAGRPRKEISVG